MSKAGRGPNSSNAVKFAAYDTANMILQPDYGETVKRAT